MLASCDLSSFVLMFMTKVCKGESRKNENRDWVGGRGGGGTLARGRFLISLVLSSFPAQSSIQI